MMRFLLTSLALAGLCCFASAAHAQKPPEVGYIFPSGGKAGTTVEVRLGGYDWTPDMDYFVHDPRVKLIPSGPPGPILIAGPPYWFGAKGRLGQPPLPREVAAKLVIPVDMPAGRINWQAANANGGTSTGTFIVSHGTEVIEDERRNTPQVLPALPLAVSGRVQKIEEIDRYRFSVTKDGPVTCEVQSRRIGGNFLAVLAVHDDKGQLIADVTGTSLADPALTFAAKAGVNYVVSVHDIDFGGDRCYVYRLSLTAGPRVLAAIPAAGRRGETREVEFVGCGVASGAPKLESIRKPVAFPNSPTGSFDYRLDTAFGSAPPFALQLSDLPEAVATPRQNKLTLPGGVTGVLDQAGVEDRHTFEGKKGEVWSLSLSAKAIGSPLDVSLVVLSADGKELVRSDDLPGTTDAALDFTAPADGSYQVVVNDMAGQSGTRAAVYHLTARPVTANFTLQLPVQQMNVPLGGKFDLALKAVRSGGFKGPIAITVKGLPAGVTAPPNLVIAADKADLVIPLTAANDTGTGAGFISVEGTATVGTASVTHPALAKAAGNLSPRIPDEGQLSTILLTTTIKAPFKGRPVDADTGRKVHRGTTFPAEVIVERTDGFQGEVVLQMSSRQSYQMHGITGGEAVVPPGVGKVLYPCFMPEWLETSRTSRVGMIGVAKIPDPKGKVRHVVVEMTGFITMTMEGALLKVSHEDRELTLPAGQPFDVRLKVSRLTKLSEPVKLELRLTEEQSGHFKADSVVVPVGREDAVFRITPTAGLIGEHTFTIRGTAIQDGKYPVVSEATITVEFTPATGKPR